jgi:hypothetical protein
MGYNKSLSTKHAKVNRWHFISLLQVVLLACGGKGIPKSTKFDKISILGVKYLTLTEIIDRSIYVPSISHIQLQGSKPGS